MCLRVLNFYSIQHLISINNFYAYRKSISNSLITICGRNFGYATYTYRRYLASSSRFSYHRAYYPSSTISIRPSVHRNLLKHLALERHYNDGNLGNIRQECWHLQNKNDKRVPLSVRKTKQNTDAPTTKQLKKHFAGALIPMVGFGFMDNLIMLQAGELIDLSIGVTFGLSTLTAAAVGQIFSDVSGVCFSGAVGSLANQLGLPNANLSPIQRRMGRVRLVGTLGRALGVILGCTLGVTSLLFMDLEEPQRLRRLAELQPVFLKIIHRTKEILNVQVCSENSDPHIKKREKQIAQQHVLKNCFNYHHHCHRHNDLMSMNNIIPQPHPVKHFLIQEPPPVSIQQFSTDNKLQCVTLDTIMNYVVQYGQGLLLQKDKNHQMFVLKTGGSETYIDLNDKTFLSFSSEDAIDYELLCYPIFDDINRPIGVIEVRNKKNGKFTENDETLVRMLSEHLSLYLGLGSPCHYQNGMSKESTNLGLYQVNRVVGN